MTMSKNLIPDTINLSEPPEASEWEAVIFGDAGILITPNKGDEPNLFHRCMHRVFFGVVWRKRVREVSR